VTFLEGKSADTILQVFKAYHIEAKQQIGQQLKKSIPKYGKKMV